MDKNTALLWSLLAEAAEWATRQQRGVADRFAAVANDARAQCAQFDPNTAEVVRYLARGLVEALASPNRRGLTSILDDIKNQIGEAPPAWGDVKKALQDMCAHMEGGGDTFEQASKVVRFYLTRPVGRE
jgi:hypothetical protein